ncbi:MAG: ImmA/IrrE family metallo-endopeptidase [Phycisphaerales bacterium]|nr:ImmA/IrrE family metallo-endopeptidase [Phycisphaerales bacterium]
MQLQLTLEIQDLTKIFGVGDVHGAIWFKEKRIAVDAELDPDRFPSKIGRYRFTLAHEGGHDRLHKLLFLADPNQASLLDETTNSPSYICRSSESKMRVEWQADQFAAALLMPREMVRREWQEWRGSDEPVTWREAWQFEHDISEPLVFDASADVSPILESFCRPFAVRFGVSAAAMRIRLEDLELLIREREPMLF